MKYTPVLPTRFTDFCFYLAPHYTQFTPDSLCARLEMKLMDCFEAYGLHKAETKCAELIYDMFECKNRTFQTNRFNAIRKERMKQYRAGKLDKPFDEYPSLDSYLFT